MAKSLTMTTLEQLDVRLREHTRDVVNLRTALDIQMNRIYQMYVEPGVQPHARQRHQSLRFVTIHQPRPQRASPQLENARFGRSAQLNSPGRRSASRLTG
jgi:hypothetical protein